MHKSVVTTPSGIPIPLRSPQGVHLEGAPALGLRPQWIWVELRIREIEEAMERYQARKQPIPSEWDNELSVHRAWCAANSPLPSSA